MWLGVHLFYLTGFKNRVTAVLHWAVSFLGRHRAERTTTEQQTFARAALQRLEHRAGERLLDSEDPAHAVLGPVAGIGVPVEQASRGDEGDE